MSSWRCPYCNQIATLLSDNKSDNYHHLNRGNKDGELILLTHVVICPNTECREYTIEAKLYQVTPNSALKLTDHPEQVWKLKPRSSAQPMPDYVPKPIREDYEEACLIVDLSPKASATLSRRCLQGMIRDFHGIVKDRLVEEVNAIKDKIDPTTWEAINAVRSIGNIGAHMEKDINRILEVDPGEATTLIQLIETLIDEWYVHRYKRAQRMNAIIGIAAAKKEKQVQSLIENKSPALNEPDAKG